MSTPCSKVLFLEEKIRCNKVNVGIPLTEMNIRCNCWDDEEVARRRAVADRAREQISECVKKLFYLALKYGIMSRFLQERWNSLR